MSKQLIAIRDKLMQYEGKTEQNRVVTQKLLTRFDDIESLTLDELHARNIKGGLVGLDVMMRLKPSDEQYRNAANLLKNPQDVVNIMLQRGLDTGSEYYRDCVSRLGGEG